MTPKPQEDASVNDPRVVYSETTDKEKERRGVKNIGLMITKNDEEIIGDWFDANLDFFDFLYILDGSTTEATRETAEKYDRVAYYHEQSFNLRFFTDQALRGVLHAKICESHGYDNWITLCHADEFFYHDPGKIIDRLQHVCDHIAWYSLHFVPHKKDLPDYESKMTLPIPERFRYFFWNRYGNGRPVVEWRQFKNGPNLVYGTDQGRVIPANLRKGYAALKLPCYLHYKIYSLNLDKYTASSNPKYQHFSRFSDKWDKIETGFTGIPFRIDSREDLFIDDYGHLQTCSYYDGILDFVWNIGDQYK